MIYYTEEHEWLSCDGDIATLGITQHAADALGDIVLVDPTENDTELEAGGVAAVIESVKAASEIYVPLAGTIIEANPVVINDPSLVNTDPEGEGWLLRIKMADPAALEGLMDRAAYTQFIA